MVILMGVCLIKSTSISFCLEGIQVFVLMFLFYYSKICDPPARNHYWILTIFKYFRLKIYNCKLNKL